MHDIMQVDLVGSLQDVVASGKSLQNGIYFTSNFLQPHSVGLRQERCFFKQSFHMLACNAALKICCFKASRVGGMFFIDRPPCVNSIRRALFMSQC